MSLDQQTTPRRPLGLTLALIAIAAIYGALPLLEIYFLKRLDATTEEAFLLGGVTIGTWQWVQGGFGAVILVVCVLAWWGRPPSIRFILMALLLFLTGVNLYRIVEAWTATIDPIFGGQTQEAIQGYLRCQFPLMVLVPIYVMWYLNRAPARAFYRRVPLERLAQPDPSPSTSEIHGEENSR